MGRLQADGGALRAHAAFCEQLATDVGAGTTPASSPNSYQATTAAVDAMHGTVDVARTALARRLRSTAAAVHGTAAALDARESTSAAELRSLTP